jgi:hypothetical protein
VAGDLAALRDDTKAALRYLRDASGVPSSEEMAYLPPIAAMLASRHLCRTLIDAGYQADVLAFLEHFATINVSQRDDTLRTAANMRAGKGIP